MNGTSPDILRKRRQRSQSSPELMQSPSRGDSAGAGSGSGGGGGESRGGGIGGDDVGESSSGSRRDDATLNERDESLTLRRREANRLAAQRFRSRKKGYQDSLEEKIRMMEDERDVLLQRLGEAPGDAKDPTDPDVRVAALESANRHLRDELGSLREENDRLRDELEAWRRWRDDRVSNGLYEQIPDPAPATSLAAARPWLAPATILAANATPTRAHSIFSRPTRCPTPTHPPPAAITCDIRQPVSTALSTAIVVAHVISS